MPAEIIRLYRTSSGAVFQLGESYYSISTLSWDDLVISDDLEFRLRDLARHSVTHREPEDSELLAPIGSQ